MKGFYAPNLSIYEIYEDAPPWNAKAWYRFIAEQHENEKLAELYQTLFCYADFQRVARRGAKMGHFALDRH